MIRASLDLAFVAPPGALPLGPLADAARRGCKRGLDIVGSAALLAVLAPLFLVLAVLIRADGGPALYSHRRVGRGGHFFG